jgi:uncharacterized protein (TIGR03437 family)
MTCLDNISRFLHLSTVAVPSGRHTALALMLLMATMATPAQSQALPQITSAGVVNAASYAQPISPGSIVSIFGTNLANSRATASGIPLPTELGGSSVTVNGTKAPLFFVSPNQINLQVPSSAPWSYSDYTQAAIVVTTLAGASASVQAPVFQSGPSLFSTDGSGCGQAAAWNVGADGKVSANSRSNSAAPGDFVSLYGIGFGLPGIPVGDGTFLGYGDSFQIAPGVVLDDELLPYFSYAGLAPTIVGVDQINIRIPPGTPEGCAIPVAVESAGMLGPTLSISIHSGRGQCVDPPVQSYGSVILTKTTSSGTNNPIDAETLTATFPSGAGLEPPQPPVATQGYVGNVYAPATMSRTCTVIGRSQLSAGPLGLQAVSTGQTVTAQPVPTTGGVTYQQTLPSGFVAPGQYMISGSGKPVVFQGTLTVPSPIHIQTTLTPGTTISASQGLVVNWTGGSGAIVKVSLVVPNGIFSRFDYGYADGSTGSITFDGICSGNPVSAGGNGVFCSFGLPPSDNATVIVEVSPLSGAASSVSGVGLTEGVQLSWIYRYVFGGLVLTN